MRLLSRLVAVCSLPLPSTAVAVGPVDHPISGVGGLLVRFVSGLYAIQQCGTYRSVPQIWAKQEAGRMIEMSHMDLERADFVLTQARQAELWAYGVEREEPTVKHSQQEKAHAHKVFEAHGMLDTEPSYGLPWYWGKETTK